MIKRNNKGQFVKNGIAWNKGLKGFTNSGSFKQGHKSGMTGKNHSKETKEKIRKANIGYKHTKEAKKKMSIAKIGRIFSEEEKRKLSISQKKRYKNPEARIKLSKRMKKEYKGGIRIPARGMLGKQHSDKTKKKMSIARLGKKWTEKRKLENSGVNSHLWKGGYQKNERNDPAYCQWVRLAKKRDNNTCWLNDETCKGYNIVHHIFSWGKYPKLRYELTNGITLCQAHHPRTRAKEELFRKLFSYLVKQKH